MGHLGYDRSFRVLMGHLNKCIMSHAGWDIYGEPGNQVPTKSLNSQLFLDKMSKMSRRFPRSEN